ncbi:MAG: hypothetical protein E7102_03185 [Prevotella ruminicola]|uniref:NVEALA protein n=1 Tax=Xylanibacter ruminicola TaxID=839 RepID=A0A928BT55_XYLRU|nr:hypothetical protein [Xylanibacter ruminicola]
MKSKVIFSFLFVSICLLCLYSMRESRNNTSQLMLANIEALAQPESGGSSSSCAKSRYEQYRASGRCSICGYRPYFSGTVYWCEATINSNSCKEGDDGYLYPCRCNKGQPASSYGNIVDKTCPKIKK